MNQDAATKKIVVHVLEQIGTLLELKGENPFKSRAYYNAARLLDSSDLDITAMVAEGRLSSVRGIGAALSSKITELVNTGNLQYYNDLKSSVPAGHLEMLRIPGLGPKKIFALHQALRIENIGELEYACKENRLIELRGFGKKSQMKILAGIDQIKKFKDKHLYSEAFSFANNLLKSISGWEGVAEADLAGSIRRRNEIVKDIDLVASSKSSNMSDLVSSLPEVEAVTEKGDTMIGFLLINGMKSDLRIVSKQEYPYALHHFTGSKHHNVAMRHRAKQIGIKMNEYGLFAGDRIIPCQTERDIFAALKMEYIAPELREDCGEIEAAQNGRLPRLVTHKDIKGVFHIHTNFSDGSDSLSVIAARCMKMGLKYGGIADHSQSAFYARGLSVEDIKRQHKEIDRINRSNEDFRLFKGIECDIHPDGSLDYSDDVLSTFDFVIAAVHSHFSMSEEEMTGRVVRALENRHTTMLAHPTGRLLLAREPYRIDMEKIIEKAAELGKVIELNANPHRLDLDWRFCLRFKKLGGIIAINPDAHDADSLEEISFGVNIARKGWIEPANCLNCMEVKELSDFLRKLRP